MLLESGLLRLLLLRLLVSISAVSILEPSLLRLHAGRLVVGIVQEARLLRLLLLLYRVAEPIHRSLLLVTLVESGWLSGLRWSVVKEQVGLVLVILLSLAQFFLFSTQLERLCKIIIVVPCGFLFAASSASFLLASSANLNSRSLSSFSFVRLRCRFSLGIVGSPW